ncbi:hypothetical protein [Streptomyces cinereoruber]|uniref:hypothetical protein n=1 Tax=Streptomyces cinereoruber TaxID=67260 RepID=UPI003C30637E
MIRRGEVPADHPPIEIKDWLRRSAAQVAATYTGVEEAVSWIEGELTQNPPVDQEHFPVWDRLQRVRERLRLTAGNDVVLGYCSKAQQYVSRAHRLPARGRGLLPLRRGVTVGREEKGAGPGGVTVLRRGPHRSRVRRSG